MALLCERASESSTPTFEMFSFVNSYQDLSFIKWIIREVFQTPLAPPSLAPPSWLSVSCRGVKCHHVILSSDRLRFVCTEAGRKRPGAHGGDRLAP